MGTICRRSGEMDWMPHAEAAGLMMKALLELPDEGITVRLHRLPPAGIPEHSHPRRHVMWVLSGRGRLWVSDAGDLDLEPGVFVFIPSGLPHRFHSLQGELELYTVTIGSRV